MTDEKLKELQDKIRALCEECGVINASVCGIDAKSGQFIGFNVFKSDSVGDLFESTMAVGRMWQHCRTQIREIMNDFDGSNGGR